MFEINGIPNKQSFEFCSWIPLTILKFLLFNSSFLNITIPALTSNCSYASSVLNKIRNPRKFCGFHLNMRIPLTFCGVLIHLRNPEQPAIIAGCRNRDTQNMSTKFRLQLFILGTHGNFVSGVHFQFGTCLKTSFWNPEQTDTNLSPIQCTVWPRNVLPKTNFKYK